MLAGSTAPTEGAPKPLGVLLVAGPKDHGPGEHDYPAWLRLWSELLAAAEGVTVGTAMQWSANEPVDRFNELVPLGIEGSMK